MKEVDRVVEAAISRQGFLGEVLAFGSGAAAMGTAGAMLSGTAVQAQAASRFAFSLIAIQTDHSVSVPEGYTWDVLVGWGDPIFPDAPEFDHETGADAESADRVFGENTDGMETFRAGGNRLLAIQHEYTNREVNLPHAADEIPTSVEDVRNLQKLQGVSVIEVAEDQTGRQVSRTVLSTAGSRTGHR